MMDDQSVIRRFHQIYYDQNYHGGTWRKTFWMGVPIYKCPLDIWLYQEMIFSTMPDFIVETGSAEGGSGLFLASMCDQIGKGSVVSVDIENKVRPYHPRLTFLNGSTSDEGIAGQVRDRISGKVMVILDSDHTRDHVLKELDLFAPMVSPGCYLVVEDTNINDNPVVPMWGPGPKEALDEWLPSHPEFSVDEEMHKFLVSFNPGGYLIRSKS